MKMIFGDMLLIKRVGICHHRFLVIFFFHDFFFFFFIFDDHPLVTFTILAIIKLFSLNFDFKKKLVVHSAKSSRNFIVVYCAWLFHLLYVYI
jgi:hypothetical protein